MKKWAKCVVLSDGLIHRIVFRISHKFKQKYLETSAKCIIFLSLVLILVLNWPWPSVDGVERCEGTELSSHFFFLLNIGVLCEGGSTRGLDSWTWSKTCQYFALSDDVVCRSKPWDSILTYPKIAGLEAIQKTSKSSKLLIIFSLLREHAFLLSWPLFDAEHISFLKIVTPHCYICIFFNFCCTELK